MLGINDIVALVAIAFPVLASALIAAMAFISNAGMKSIRAATSILGMAEIVIMGFISYFAISGEFSLALNGDIVFDGFSAVPLFFASFILQLVLQSAFVENEDRDKAAIFVMASFLSLLASFLLASTSSISLFISSWLLLSISSYAAVAAAKSKEASDAALKYALMGALSTVFIVMWLGSGSYLAGDNIYSANWYGSGKLFLLASAFLLAGVGFKLGIFPFQWWMPDVYTYAEGSSIALITGVAKIGAILGFSRMMYYTFFIGPSKQMVDFIAIMSILTMTFGNIAALTTKVLPRILAYSSIAQMGYILVGIVGMLYGASTGDQNLVYLASGGIAVQAVAYGLAKSASYLFSGELGMAAGDERLRGIFSADSVSIISMMTFLLSLLGLPPLIGFWGKLYLFESAVSYSLPLVVIAIINSGISSYYYGRLISMMFSGRGEGKKFEMRIAYATISILLLLLGLGVMQLLFPHLSIKTL